MNKQANKKSPFKKGVGIGLIVIWDVACLIDFLLFFLGKTDFPLGNSVLSALTLVFLVALFSLISSDFRQLILKDGLGLKDIKPFALILMVVSGGLFSILTLVLDLSIY